MKTITLLISIHFQRLHIHTTGPRQLIAEGNVLYSYEEEKLWSITLSAHSFVVLSIFGNTAVGDWDRTDAIRIFVMCRIIGRLL